MPRARRHDRVRAAHPV